MATRKTLSPYALRILAEIDATGVWIWNEGSIALLNDPQRTRVKVNTVDNLVRDGYLEPVGDLELKTTSTGAALLDRNPEARGRALSVHQAQQLTYSALGVSIKRGNPKSTPHA